MSVPMILAVPLYGFRVFVELEEELDAKVLLDDIAQAICADPGHSRPGHECTQDFAVLVGEVDEGEIDWREQVAASFSAFFGGDLG